MKSRSLFTLIGATAVVAGGIGWLFSPGLPAANAQAPTVDFAKVFEAKLDKLEVKSDRLEAKFDRLFKGLDEALPALANQGAANLEIDRKLEAKLDRLEGKLDKYGKVGGGTDGLPKLEAKLDRLEGKIDKAGQSGGHLEVLQKLEAKLDKLQSGGHLEVLQKLEAKLDKLERKLDQKNAAPTTTPGVKP